MFTPAEIIMSFLRLLIKRNPSRSRYATSPTDFHPPSLSSASCSSVRWYPSIARPVRMNSSPGSPTPPSAPPPLPPDQLPLDPAVDLPARPRFAQLVGRLEHGDNAELR